MKKHRRSHRSHGSAFVSFVVSAQRPGHVALQASEMLKSCSEGRKQERAGGELCVLSAPPALNSKLLES